MYLPYIVHQLTIRDIVTMTIIIRLQTWNFYSLYFSEITSILIGVQKSSASNRIVCKFLNNKSPFVKFQKDVYMRMQKWNIYIYMYIRYISWVCELISLGSIYVCIQLNSYFTFSLVKLIFCTARVQSNIW